MSDYLLGFNFSSMYIFIDYFKFNIVNSIKIRKNIKYSFS
jgi:hypothetical protein